jgi:hypothetical protein
MNTTTYTLTCLSVPAFQDNAICALAYGTENLILVHPRAKIFPVIG